MGLSLIVSFLVMLVIAGVVLYLINTRIPMDGTIKNIINVVVIILVIVWLLHKFGLFQYIHL